MSKRIVPIVLALSLLAALSPAIAGPGSAKPEMAPPQAGPPPLDGQHLFNDGQHLFNDGQHLFNDTFTRITTVNALPPSVLHELLGTKEKAEQETGGTADPAEIADLIIRDGMADPGQPFETSDMVGPKPLPFRRLVFAGVSRGYCFVYNEYGGFAEGSEILLYRLPPPTHAAPGLPLPQPGAAGHATLVWQASLHGSKLFQTWEQLRVAIIQGRYYTLSHQP